MDAAIVGFGIAIAIGLTGVGGGIITAPLLIVFFGVPAPAAVGTALIFGAITKLMIVPVYAARRQVCFRTLGLMVAGGLPGVLGGSLLLSAFDTTRHHALISVMLGGAIVVFSVFSLYRFVRVGPRRPPVDRSWLLPALALPIGVEVGFSSAGSGSLASLALMALTPLETPRVVGTDVCFGLVISLVGGGVLLASGHYDSAILPSLVGGGIAGALIAPHLAARIPARPFRFGLLVWITLLGGKLFLQGILP
jgi:uncharacterized membrane protein YfcA